MNRGLKRAIAFLLSAILLLSLSVFAFAEDDTDIRDRKGAAPAESTRLDRTLYADGSAYDNPPTDVRVVRIGISYEDSAVDQAYFRNQGGGGFRIGYYDEQRSFQEIMRTGYDLLKVCWAGNEENGLMVQGGDYEEILYLSREAQSVAFEPLDGETAYGDSVYRGGFECRKYAYQLMTVVNVVDLETYVKGVIPYEMAPSWPFEALKAQAVCARTYVVYNQNAYPEFGFDLTDNTESQVYRGTTWATEKTDAAVDATAGELIRYKGEICEIYYFAADGGATEDGQYVFDSDRPYLLGKRDPFERTVNFGYQAWRRTYTGEELSARMALRDFPFETVRSMELERSALGNVIAITYVGESGARLRLQGRDCYVAIGLPDCRFSVYWDGSAFHFYGSGLGHSCGMSQWGARAMDEVYGYDYNDIIRFYFTGAYIA